MACSDDEDLSGLTQSVFLKESSQTDFDIFSDLLPLEIITSEKTGDVEQAEENLPVIEIEETLFQRPTPVRKRNISLVTDEELNERKDGRIPNNTKLSTAWALRVWQDWAVERNNRTSACGSREKTVNPDILTNSNDELDYWLAKLVVEIRKKEEPGQFYPPNTLYQLSCGIQRFLRNNGRAGLNIFEDPYFKHFQDCLDAEMKRLTGLGVGARVKEAEAFTIEQEEKLWNLNVLRDVSASVLLNTIVFLIGKNFALRSGQEHRNLKFSQLVLEPASDNEPEKLVYTSFGEKNNLGGLKHRATRRKRVEHYANEACPDRCLVNLYKKYKKKCSKSAIEKDVFYLSPRRKYEITDEENCVGRNTLGDTVKKICKAAGIEGHYTNHSLRATTATRGLMKGIPEKYVMQRTGHRDVRSLQKYQRPDVATKVRFSKAFDCETGSSIKDEESKKESKQQSVKRISDSNGESSASDGKKLCSDRVKDSVENRVCFQNCTFVVDKDFKCT